MRLCRHCAEAVVPSDAERQWFAAVGLDPRRHVESDSSLLRPLDLKYSVGDPAKAEKILGWKATVPFDEMIDRLVRAEQEVRHGAPA